RAGKQIGNSQFNRPCFQICLVETSSLNANHSQNVVPLTIGDLATLAIPELGEDCILGGGDWKPDVLEASDSRRGVSPASEFRSSEPIVSGWKDIKFVCACDMDHVESVAGPYS